MDHENGGMKLNDDFLVISVYLEQTILVIERTNALAMMNFNFHLNLPYYWQLIFLIIENLKL